MPENRLRTYKDATAVVTGAASGIGRELSRELARRGAEVVLADLQVEKAEEVAEAIRADGGKAQAASLDVTDYSAVDKLLRDTRERTGRLDYVFNNAGIAVTGPALLHTVEDWNRTIDVNLRGVVNGCHAAYLIMAQQGFGHIVNTASMGGLMAMPGEIAYTTAKHGVVGLSRALRLEASIWNLRVSVLCPGLIRTEILEDGGAHGRDITGMSPEKKREFIERYHPMDPAVFARRALDAVAKNRMIIIQPWWWRISWWWERLSPAMVTWFFTRQVEAIKRDIDRMRAGGRTGPTT